MFCHLSHLKPNTKGIKKQIITNGDKLSKTSLTSIEKNY